MHSYCVFLLVLIYHKCFKRKKTSEAKDKEDKEDKEKEGNLKDEKQLKAHEFENGDM